MPRKYSRLNQYATLARQGYNLARNAYSGYKLFRDAYGKIRKVRSDKGKLRGSIKKRTKLSQRALTNGTGGSFSKFYYGMRRIRRPTAGMIKRAPKQYFGYDQWTIVNATSSQQKFQTVSDYFGITDFNNIASDIVPYGATPGTNSGTTPFWCLSVSADIQFSNLTSTNTRLVIWDIIARTDISFPPETILSQYAYLEQDVDSSNISTTDYVFNPFTCRKFTEAFIVKKMTHVLLAEGQTHIHRIHYAPNKFVNATLPDANEEYLRKLSAFTMVQVFGTPASDGEAQNEHISSTTGHLGVLVKKMYKTCYLQNWGTTLHQTATTLSPITPKVIDIASGNAESEVET